MAGTRAELIAKLAAQAVQSTNSLHFLRTAHQRDIPWQLVSQPVYRLGWGHRSRWLDSTLTDRTPGIGVGLAHNKHRSAELLNRLGLPVPSHAVVSSADSAERHAAALGYPVVVKPVDTDGGRGVTTNLCSPEAVRAAFATAAEHSTKVMVQKHVGGRDYRLTVFQGRLVWAIMRAPGGVTGDGSHDVAELVERLNAGRYAAKMLHLDAAALDLLAEQGLTRDSVPEPGQFVRLRTAANVTQGGTAVAVLDQVHPDNRILAERVAAAFRLDIAGIDLLIDDISRSWMETGAYICEVNAQPQLGITTQQHLYGAILDELVPHGGRIPTAVIVGAEAEKMAADILRRMGGSRAAGTASSGGAWIGGRQVLPAQAGLHAATQLLLSSTDVELALVAVSNDAVLKSGLAFDRYDLLVVAGAGPSWLPATVEMVEPNNAGPTLFAREDPALPTFATAKKIRNLQAVGGASEGLARAASLLLQQRLQPGTASGA
jgi:cyanophycin synthetase